MSRQKRNKAIKQRHASTRLKKLEAELTRLQGGGKVTTVMDFPMRFGEGRDAHTNRVAWLKSEIGKVKKQVGCLLYTSPSPRDRTRSRMPSSA